MSFGKKHIKSNFWLLAGCIAFLALGMGVMFLGALIHINPGVHHFSSLFHQESLMNLVYSLIPSIR